MPCVCVRARSRFSPACELFSRFDLKCGGLGAPHVYLHGFSRSRCEMVWCTVVHARTPPRTAGAGRERCARAPLAPWPCSCTACTHDHVAQAGQSPDTRDTQTQSQAPHSRATSQAERAAGAYRNIGLARCCTLNRRVRLYTVKYVLWARGY